MVRPSVLWGTALSCLAAAFIMAVGPTGSASADSVQSDRYGPLPSELTNMMHSGASMAQIKDRLGLTLVSDAPAGVQPDTNGDVTLDRPDILKNSNGTYYVYVGWEFHGSKTEGSDTTGNIGGRDQFSVAMSKNVDNLDGNFNYCPRSGTCTRGTNYATSNAAGVGWAFQDKANKGARNFVTGAATFRYKPLSGGCIQAFTRYSHTWNKTGISSISIGIPMSISVSYSNEGSEWERASAPGSYGC